MARSTVLHNLLRVALWLAVYGMVIALVVVCLALSDRIPFPLNLLQLWVMATPLLYYLGIPFCKVFRAFDYLSAYTVLYGSKRKGRLAIHLSMNYDVFWRLMPQRRSGEALSLTLQRDIYAGMVALCDRIAEGKIRPDATLSVGSYFLNPRKLERLGMKRKGRSFSNAINFTLAYPSVLLDQLLLSGHLRFFNPLNVVTYTVSAADLLAHRAYFDRKHRALSAEADTPVEGGSTD